jgi:LmbE family N-acetylglucosaminyl deacetylase
MTACRPAPDQPVKEIYSFEIASSTEWSPNGWNNTFRPTVFVDISDYYAFKVKALKVYREEMMEFPNSRSLEGVEALARWRGVTVGRACAEAFMVERILIDSNS